MSEILLYYKRPDPTTWVYLSSFLTIGLFFVFHRFWSIRNVDIVLLILLSPGLLMVHEGYRRELIATEALAVESMPGFAVAENATSDRSTAVDSEQDQLTAVAPAVAETGEEDQTDPEVAAQDDLPAEPESQPESAAESAAERSAVGSPDKYSPDDIQRYGFIYLFVIQSFILLRSMLDPLMVRRPLLDPNLTTGGLNFIGISLFIFMMANVVTSSPMNQKTQGPELGPGYTMMNMLPRIPTRPVSESPGGVFPPGSSELTDSQTRLARIAKGLAIVAHLAIVSAIVLISNRHFSNLRAGVGCATLYLMLPYTAQFTGRVDHALPAALLLWAVLCYRKPAFAGFFLGLAGGLVYYPLFLLPLWFSFYWQRGARSFAIGVFAALVLLMVAIFFDQSPSSTEHLRRMYGLLSPNREAHELQGIWSLGWNPVWRWPVIAAFVILSVFFAIWPAQKNLGTLISGSAAVMVAAQFWHGSSGGLYIAWFLPLLLLTIFRPNLQDRVATKVVIGSPITVRGSRAELEPV
jgi:hypothetical protein